jgi:enterochelin esterase-like enzyme
LSVFQSNKGSTNSWQGESFVINAKTLQNTGGENANRKISVYLPPNYESTQKRFPVVYYLHGFMGNDSITTGMKAIFDKSIAQAKIRPFILVIASQYTLFEGSFYSNSALTGNWSEFEAKELVTN